MHATPWVNLKKHHASLKREAQKTGVMNPLMCNYSAAATEAHVPRSLCSTREATTTRSPCAATKSSPRSLQLEEACTQQQKPAGQKKVQIMAGYMCGFLMGLHWKPQGNIWEQWTCYIC